MKQFLLLLSCLLILSLSKAQFQTYKDSVVQVYGVVMTADSLIGLEGVSIRVLGQNRGTFTNSKGVFSIVVLKGDNLEFSSVGFLAKTVSIPKSIEGNQQSLIQLMTADTVYLPATLIKQRPSREQFEREFVNGYVPDDNIAIARRNNSEATRRFLMATLPSDGRETANLGLRNYANRASYQGQVPPMNILNPFAWAEFVKAWKRGDFKKKK